MKRVVGTFTLVWLLSPSVSSVPADRVELKRPEGVAFDNRDHIYVADRGNHRVVEFDERLQFIRQFGSGNPGSGPGDLNEPRDVAVPVHRSFIVVADSGNNRIVLFRPDGTFLSSFGEKGQEPGEFDLPSNIALDEYGHVIVTDRNNHRLQVFNPTGRLVGMLANRTGPRSREKVDGILEYDREIQSEKVREDLPGEWDRRDPGQLNWPAGVFYDRELGRLFVGNGDSGWVGVFDYDAETGEIARREPVLGVVSHGLDYCSGCVGTPDGGLVVVQRGKNAIRVFEDRAALRCDTRHLEIIEPDVFGGVRGFSDIAMAPKSGRLAVVDERENRVLVFDRGFRMPEPPRIESIGARDAAISYRTEEEAPTEVILRRSPYSLHVPEEYVPEGYGEPQLLVIDKNPSTEHSLVLDDLDPSTRYYYRVFMPGLRAIPSDGWSREFALNTRGGQGRKSFIRAPVRVLLIANIVTPEDLEEDGDAVLMPEPMSDEEIEEYYREPFREAELFFWVNSRMCYQPAIDLFVDRAFYVSRKPPATAPEWMRDLPTVAEGESWAKVLGEAGKEDIHYTGLVVCQAERKWNPDLGEWVYRGSGGGTYGLKYSREGAGSSHFLGGSDVAWLFTHEYKHQVESQYHTSGLVREDDRMWFCHFAPRFDDPETPWVDWKWATAADHGAHWDGIAWQLRHMTGDQYLRNMWGQLASAEDGDEDGIPDDVPGVPLDEKQFGSSPRDRDTDGDGLADLDEALASTWVRATNTPVRNRVTVPYIRPDPAAPDSDGDGVSDGEDRYPIYPYPVEIPRGRVRIDGGVAEWDDRYTIRFHREDLGPEKLAMDMTIRACYTDSWLTYSIVTEDPHRDISLLIDADADGRFRGNDNMTIRIGPKGFLKGVEVGMCEMNRWPYSDHHVLRKREILYSVKSLGEHQEIEFALPRRPDLGLDLVRGERIGLQVIIDLPEGGRVSVFEPYSIFDSVLGE